MSKIKREVTVLAPPHVVYGVWHNFENLPRFMDNIEEVRAVADGRSHWKAKGPLGRPAEWDAEITMDEPDAAIGWRSIEGSGSVKTAGRVNFRPATDDATSIELTIEYEAPAGIVGEVAAKIFANPERQVEQDLARFKQVVEQSYQASSAEEANGAPLGSSMGATTEAGMDRISERGDGSSPQGVDDPAMRN